MAVEMTRTTYNDNRWQCGSGNQMGVRHRHRSRSKAKYFLGRNFLILCVPIGEDCCGKKPGLVSCFVFAHIIVIDSYNIDLYHLKAISCEIPEKRFCTDNNFTSTDCSKECTGDEDISKINQT